MTFNNKLPSLAFYGYVPFYKGNLVIFQKTSVKTDSSPMFSNMKHYLQDYVFAFDQRVCEVLD